MPVMNAYAPGTFCWADLGTSDPGRAKRFYTALFGWTADDRPSGPDTVYSIFMREGRSVAALYAQEPSPGVPPHWLSYASVASAADTAARARALGGALIHEPFDVLDVGRMAVLQDPGGAVLALWEPRRHVGAGIVGETNAMCWHELATARLDEARDFYTRLFGWIAETRRLDATDYTTFMEDGMPRAGMLAIDSARGPVPPHWLVYFAVSDCDGQVALVQSLGGSVRVPPTDVPHVGRYAVVADPQGAVFAVIALEQARAAAGG
jgi:uncharacterized protein